MTTLEKLEKGIFKLDEFDEQQKTFITALVKMSFIDGLQNKANLSDDIHNVSISFTKLEQVMREWNAIPNDWRHFFDELKNEC